MVRVSSILDELDRGPSTPEHVLGQAEAHVPALKAYQEELSQLLAATSIPNFESVYLLVEAVQRLRSRLTGLGRPEDWPEERAMQGVLAAIRTSPAKKKFYLRADKVDTRAWAERYGTYLALLERQPVPDPGPECLRAVLLFGAWTWRRSRHDSALEALASAIRGRHRQSGRKFSGSIEKLVSAAAMATSAEDLARRVPDLTGSTHAALGKAWSALFVPLLEGTRANPARVRTGPSPSSGTPDRLGGGAVKDVGQPLNLKRDKRSDRPTTPVPRPASIRIAGLPKERGEPDSDAYGSVAIASVPQDQAGFAAGRAALFRAFQTVWSRNSLMLTEHVESLTRIEAAAVGRRVVEKLRVAIEREDKDGARIWARVGLSLVTGRTTKVLRSARVRKKLSALARTSKQWDILPTAGCIHFPLPDLENAFVPSGPEKNLLVETRDDLTLPLPKLFAGQLRQLERLDVEMTATPDWKNDLKRGCRELSRDLGFPITPGRLRRTLACLLVDAAGDVVATVLITGNSFGLSTAPLFYRAPREIDLQRLYARVTADLVGGEPAEPLADPDTRVGAKTLLTDQAMRSLGRALGTAVHAGIPSAPDRATSARLHNELVDHLAGMILMTAGHRPTDALFALVRGDFDTLGNGALFSDKKFDLAHACRYAAIPPLLSRQIEGYLQHLRALRVIHPSTGSHVAECLAGRTPLLFRLTPEHQLLPLDLASWTKTLPGTWSILPRNLGRTLIATLGPEMEARAEAVATTLGHFESVGFPFGTDGPTEPLVLAEHLAPVLEAIARRSGWVLRAGLTAGALAGPWQEWGPLEDWRDVIRRSEVEMRDLVRKLRVQQRASVLSLKRDTEALVLDLLHPVAAVLAGHLRADTKRLPAETHLELLTTAAVSEIAEEIRRGAGGEGARMIAGANALARLLKRAQTRWGWPGSVPDPIRMLHRPEQSPFFPGMMRARHQIEALRSHFVDSIVPRPGEVGAGTRTSDFARTALAVVLFGFVEDPAQAVGILARRAAGERSKAIPDLLLVGWGESPSQVVGLRGLSAVAIGALAKRYPTGVAPDEQELDAALAVLLPRGAVPVRGGVLAQLCATVAVANRIELSGAARSALHLRDGSVSARASEQVAFIDGDPVAPLLQLPEMASTPSRAQHGDSPGPVPKLPRSHAREQYKAMLKVFPSKDHDTRLPRTGVVITQANIERSRGLVIRELRAWSRSSTTNNIVAALAWWARRMLLLGTQDEATPAFSTVQTYLTTVGGHLVELGAGLRLADLEEAELTRLFQDVVEIKKRDDRRSVTARELQHFHASVAERFDLAELDADDFAEYLRHVPQAVDAHTIRAQERDAAIDLLARGAVFESAQAPADTRSDAANRRLFRQATVAADIVAAAGARIGESLGLRIVDVIASPQSLVARLTTNRYRRLKTDAARRVVDLTHRVSDANKTRIARWCRAELERVNASLRHAAFLFQTLDHPKRIAARRTLRDVFARSLALATGRERERVHRIRHIAGTEGLLSVFLPKRDRAGIGWLAPLSDRLRDADSLVFPRDLHAQTQVIGHSRPRTTIRTYFHLPWAARARADSWMRARFDRRHAALALGSSLANVDRIAQRRKPRPQQLAWLDHVVPARVQDKMREPNAVAPSLHQVTKSLTPREVGRILGWTENDIDAGSAALAIGATTQQLSEIREQAGIYAMQMGLEFMPTKSRQTKARRKIRQHRKAEHLYRLLDIADLRPGSSSERLDLTLVVNAVFAFARHHHRDEIALPAEDARRLRQLLVHVEHPPDLIIQEQLEGQPLVRTRVVRPGVEGRYYGRELRRLFGVVWIRDRLSPSTDQDP